MKLEFDDALARRKGVCHCSFRKTQTRNTNKMVFTQKKEVPPEPELGPGWRKVEVKKDNRVVKSMTKYWNPHGEELSYNDVKKILDSVQGQTNIGKGFKRTCAEAGWTEEGQSSGMRAGPGVSSL